MLNIALLFLKSPQKRKNRKKRENARKLPPLQTHVKGSFAAQKGGDKKIPLAAKERAAARGIFLSRLCQRALDMGLQRWRFGLRFLSFFSVFSLFWGLGWQGAVPAASLPRAPGAGFRRVPAAAWGFPGFFGGVSWSLSLLVLLVLPVRCALPLLSPAVAVGWFGRVVFFPLPPVCRRPRLACSCLAGRRLLPGCSPRWFAVGLVGVPLPAPVVLVLRFLLPWASPSPSPPSRCACLPVCRSPPLVACCGLWLAWLGCFPVFSVLRRLAWSVSPRCCLLCVGFAGRRSVRRFRRLVWRVVGSQFGVGVLLLLLCGLARGCSSA